MDVLPNELIVLILDHTPLTELLRANEVCLRWKALEPIATRKRTALEIVFEQASKRGNSLVASRFSPDFTINDDGSVDVQQWPFGSSNSQLDGNLISSRTVRLKLIDHIVTRLPKLDTLEINGQVPLSFICTIAYLLELLGQKVINLKLSFAPGSDIIESPRARRTLFRVINRSMPALRHFHFECFAACIPKSLKLPVLSQLQHFYWHTPWSINLIYPSFVQYGQPNAQLQQIGIGNCATGQKMSTLSKLVFQSDPQFAAKFTTMPHFSRHESVKLNSLKSLTTKFCSITSLRLHDLRHLTMRQVVSSLVPLKQLVYLQMNSRSKKDDPEEQLAWQLERPLATVKVLELQIFTAYHSDIQWTIYQWIFPSVEVLNVYQESACCIECAIKHDNFLEISPEVRRECIRQLCLPLKTWHMLRRINVTTKYLRRDGDNIECIQLEQENFAVEQL